MSDKKNSTSRGDSRAVPGDASSDRSDARRPVYPGQDRTRETRGHDQRSVGSEGTGRSPTRPTQNRPPQGQAPRPTQKQSSRPPQGGPGKGKTPASHRSGAVAGTTAINKNDPPAKRRPYTGCLTGLVYFMFVIGVSALLAGLIWISANEVLALNKPDKVVSVTIKETDEMSDITNTLQAAGIVNYKWLFNLYAGVTEASEKIKPGTYELNTNYDYMAVVNALRPTVGPKETVSVVIPEGFNLQQIFDRLVDKGVCTMEDLKETAQNYDFKYEFIKALPKTEKRLEGYLFPNTYEFYVGDEAVNVLNKMLSDFNNKFTDEMIELCDEMGYSIHEIVTIASLIERESANVNESSTIASVIYNRLNSDSYPFLQIDATVQYCLPEHKDRLTIEDTKIDNPYNTYEYEGLPPGPIASPGESSLGAALYPDETNYYFYAINKDGVHEFSRTKSQHDAIVAAAQAARENE